MGTERIHRLIKLITLLQSGQSKTVAQLTDQLDVARRTVFRDLQVLKEAGIPYYHQPGQGYRVSRSYYLPPIDLTVTETIGLLLLGKSAYANRKQPMMKQAMSAIAKLSLAVPESLREACLDYMGTLSIEAGPVLGDDQDETAHHAALQQSINEGRVCDLVYKAPLDEASSQWRIEPYVLHYATRAWYVIGRVPKLDQVRIFKLARISKLTSVSVVFTKPNHYRASQKLGQAWLLIPEGKVYDIELEFKKQVAVNVSEVRWHGSQTHHLTDDGRCIMRFKVDGLGEIAWWLCGYGDQVNIKKPKALRDRVKQMHQRAAQM